MSVKLTSIFNHVLGPVMRGPSSSHTAGGYHIGSMARSLCGTAPRSAVFAFDPDGSFGRTYRAQGADRAFAMGLMGKPLTGDSFFTALEDGAAMGIEIAFEVRALERPDHPNTVDIVLEAPGDRRLHAVARSIGGGEVEFTWLDGWPVLFNGSAFELLIETAGDRVDALSAALGSDHALLERPRILRRDDGGPVALTARRSAPLSGSLRAEAAGLAALGGVRESAPVYFVQTGQMLFSSAADVVRLARERRVSLGRLALEYESILLGISEAAVMEEMLRRYDVMETSVRQGLEPGFGGLQLLVPTAGQIFRAEAQGRLSAGGLHARAAARSMAVMHVDAAMGVVCAAPTGGSAGTIPGALVTLAEERGLSRESIALAMLAAGAVGVIVAQRATFAAEVAGCQVEIGASGAMAAAAIVDAVGGSAEDACHAAAIAFQNTMGLVCDPVQGMVEIPCHTRNAAAAASAFVVADLVLGGYLNPIPLDETVDAVYAVGRSMSTDLLCTARGGLSVTPSALAMGQGCCGKDCDGC